MTSSPACYFGKHCKPFEDHSNDDHSFKGRNQNDSRTIPKIIYPWSRFERRERGLFLSVGLMTCFCSHDMLPFICHFLQISDNVFLYLISSNKSYPTKHQPIVLQTNLQSAYQILRIEFLQLILIHRLLVNHNKTQIIVFKLLPRVAIPFM